MSRFGNRVAIGVFAAVMSCCSAQAGGLDNLPSVDVLPEGYVQIAPFVMREGGAYGRGVPGTLPYDPVYRVDQGKIIGIEYLLTAEELAAGKSWTNLGGLEGMPPVDHVDLLFVPSYQNGSEWKDIPLYWLRLYFVSVETLDAMRL